MLEPVSKINTKAKEQMTGFIDFIRTQGVVGFAVGFILGGSISKLVGTLVQGVINPLLSAFFGGNGELKNNFFQIGESKIMWGELLSVSIDFLIIALVIYYGVKIIGIEKFDKPKQ